MGITHLDQERLQPNEKIFFDMKLLASLLSAGSALYFDTYGADQESFNQFSASTQYQISQMRDSILRGQLPTHFMTELDKICDPCRRQVSLDEVMMLFPLPDLTSGGVNAEKKVSAFVGSICEAAQCRDRVVDCAARAQDGVCQNNLTWAQEYCPQTCGCVRKTCSDDHIPGVDEDQIDAYLDEEDAEHSSEPQLEIPMHDAVKYLDPSRIFAQFDSEVQKTLQSQMCFVPNADSRIIAANELLKVLATNQDARILAALSPKLPMYLEAVPKQMKEVLANEVICGGYKRTSTEQACLGPRISDDNRFCKASLPRYTYNTETGNCEAVKYDGCYKTENRFMTRSQCEDTCQSYIQALATIHNQKLDKFVSSLTVYNLRESLLTMFGKVDADEDTESLVDIACGPEGKIRDEFREKLCPRLATLIEQQQNKKRKNKPKKIQDNPVIIEEEICPIELGDRETCIPKPSRNFKSACEKAECCWDPQPQVKFAKWKHYCFSKKTVQTKPEISINQEISDSEHSRVPAVLSERLTGVPQPGKCEVGLGSRAFCVPRNFKLRTLAGIKEHCEASGCCFEEKTNGGIHYKWKNSCYKPN